MLNAVPTAPAMFSGRSLCGTVRRGFYMHAHLLNYISGYKKAPRVRRGLRQQRTIAGGNGSLVHRNTGCLNCLPLLAPDY